MDPGLDRGVDPRMDPGMDPGIADLVAGRPHLSLHAMDGLVMEDVPLAAIAAEVGTPCWVMSAGAIRQRHAALARAMDGIAIHYAVKANDQLAVLDLFARLGAGADVVSGGELRRALRAGMPAARVVFSGVGKTADELRLALDSGIAQINVESAAELAMLSAIAVAAGRTADIVLRINPDVDPKTHAKITTGLAGNKFGIPFGAAPALYAHAASLPGIRPVGLALHIGSQILTMAPYRAAYARAADMVRALRGSGLVVSRVDCGGGLGIPYRGEPAALPEALAGAIRAELGGLDLKLMIEPGRWLVGPAGLLLSRVILVKPAAPRRFVVLDAAMNDLLRPAMYDAWHGIVPVGAAAAVATPLSPVDVVGPVCETGDTFTRDRMLPPLAADDVVAILDAGAYGAVMSSTYNARPLAAQVLVSGDRWTVIRPRQAVQDLWAGETIPRE